MIFTSYQTFSGDEVKMNDRTRHVARVGSRKRAYRVLMRRTEGGRQFGRPRFRWKDNIKICLQKVE
jgi:hypothetical protein